MSKFTTKKLKCTPTEVAPKTSMDENPKEKVPSKKIRNIFLGLFIFLILIFGINYVVQGISNVKIGTADNGTLFAPIIFDTTEGGGITKKNGVENILIVGIGGAGHQAGELADSIMLASLDNEKKSVTMISIPRDLYVSYGSGTGAGKINSLYPIGISQKVGISLLANKVSEITGQSIHHYMVIDFSAFRYVVNALGGIEVNVEKDLYDNEYPDYNYGYTVFSVKKGLQNFDGETALRYARSRHSTSDIDRSKRQQQIINAIKNKALSAGIITSPSKIGEIIDATRRNINTDLTVGDIVELGATFGGMEKSDIHVYNLGSECFSYTQCSVGGYLYTPSMAYFGGAWAMIPEGARINKLSYYERIRKFVTFVFTFPGIHTNEKPIVVVHNSSQAGFAKNLLMEMKKIGIHFNSQSSLKTTTGSIDFTHINVYWNEDYKIGIDPESDIIHAIKFLDAGVPINIVKNNEYVKDSGPKIEIVLGKDYKEYFTFSTHVNYLPKIEDTSKTSISGSTHSASSSGVSTQKTIIIPTNSKTNLKPENKQNPQPYKIAPGEWENL